MENRLELAYEEFGAIAESSMNHECKTAALRILSGSLGFASVAFENVVYERLGLSAEDVLDMLDMGDVLA